MPCRSGVSQVLLRTRASGLRLHLGVALRENLGIAVGGQIADDVLDLAADAVHRERISEGVGNRGRRTARGQRIGREIHGSVITGEHDRNGQDDAQRHAHVDGAGSAESPPREGGHRRSWDR